MRPRIVLTQVMRVVGRNQRESGLSGQAHEGWREPLVLLQVMVLHFEEEILLPEDLAVFVSGSPRIVIFIGEQDLRNMTAQASGHRDQPFGVRREQIQIDARFVIEAVQVRGRNQLD